MIVMKFGGSSVESAAAIERVAGIVKSRLDRHPVVIVSAMGKTTNQFSVNAIAADESDLSACFSSRWGRWGDDTERRMEDTSAVWIFSLFALGLLTTHLYLVATGKGAK